MRRAIDLDPFAKTRSALAWAMNARRPSPLRPRQPQIDPNATHRLARNRDPFSFAKLLRRRRRPEIPVLGPQELFDPKPLRRFQPTWRRKSQSR